MRPDQLHLEAERQGLVLEGAPMRHRQISARALSQLIVRASAASITGWVVLWLADGAPMTGVVLWLTVMFAVIPGLGIQAVAGVGETPFEASLNDRAVPRTQPDKCMLRVYYCDALAVCFFLVLIITALLRNKLMKFDVGREIVLFCACVLHGLL